MTHTSATDASTFTIDDKAGAAGRLSWGAGGGGSPQLPAELGSVAGLLIHFNLNASATIWRRVCHETDSHEHLLVTRLQLEMGSYGIIM